MNAELENALVAWEDAWAPWHFGDADVMPMPDSQHWFKKERKGSRLNFSRR